MMRLIDEDFSDAGGKVLLIGFGRFGQVTAQMLRTQGQDVRRSSTSTSR